MTHDSTDPDEVTQPMVRLLWDRALDPSADLGSIHERAETLLARVSSENPVVNRGLTKLHALTRPPGRRVEEVREHQDAWLAEVERYEADPQGWMSRYFSVMVRDFTERHGPERGRRFASRLAQDGLLGPSEIPGRPTEGS